MTANPQPSNQFTTHLDLFLLLLHMLHKLTVLVLELLGGPKGTHTEMS